MDNETELELELVISRLTGITNEAKIYGEESVLARLESFNNSDQIFVLLNRSLTAIHTLRRVIRETITLQKDPIETPNDNSAGVVKVEIKAIHFNF